MLKFIFLILFLMNSFLVLGADKWYFHSSHKRLGQAMVVHGLNNKAQAMTRIIQELRENGYDVLNVTLAGHSGPISEMKNVRKTQWLNEFELSYLELEKREVLKGGKTLFVGFSLGGLLAVDYLSSVDKHIVEKLVLFAPALKVKTGASMIKILFFAPNTFIIPSFAPKKYRAQRGTSIGAYKGLFFSLDNIEKRALESVNIKTLVFLHKEDELVSFDKIKRFIEDKKLTNWSLVEIDNSEKTSDHHYNHLIINPSSVGEKEWMKNISKELE